MFVAEEKNGKKKKKKKKSLENLQRPQYNHI